MLPDHQNRRGAERFDLSIDVSFTVGSGMPHPGRVENISSSGILLVADTPILPGTFVRVSFTDPVKQTLHTIGGDVVRTAPDERVGISFVEMDAAALAFITQLLEAAR
jgi:hypothetical protein